MIDFSNARNIVTPKGEVAIIARGDEILWQKPAKKYKVELEYLEGTGTQYIDTGLDYFADFELGIQLRENVSNKALGNGRSYCLQRQNASTGCWQYMSGSTSYNTAIKITEYHTMTWKNNTVYADGEKLTGFVKSRNGGSRMLLFAAEADNQYHNIIHFCKMWDNGNLVRDFIPVLDWNDVPCMYDKVSGELFYNKGKGQFAYG